MNHRVMLVCAGSAPVFVVLYAIFFWGVAGFIPPPSPTLGPRAVAEFYDQNRTGIRIGMVGAMISSFLIVPFFAAISAAIGRGERGVPILAMIQFGCAMLLEVFFVMCSMIWLTATYRPDLAGSSIQMLNDLGWLIFVMVYPGYVLQMVCIAIAALTHESSFFPRWLGYLSLWVAISGIGGGFAVFVTDGPLAWNGVVGFYLPLSIFAVWMFTTATVLVRSGGRKFRSRPAPSASGG
ncbi:MAG TPA: hypothetical protein VNS46_07960 [Nocardioides sp.]|nr:hypothetical protein [Nocardioides sp.]